MTKVNFIDSTLPTNSIPVIPNDFKDGIHHAEFGPWARTRQGWITIECRLFKGKSHITTVPLKFFNIDDVQHVKSCLYYRGISIEHATWAEFLDRLPAVGKLRVNATLRLKNPNLPKSDKNSEIIDVDFHSKWKK